MLIQNFLPEFLSLALIHLIAVIVPGPDFVITVRQSIQFGRVHGVITAIGIGFGLSIHVLYTLLGVAALTHTIPWLLQLLKVIGAIYLCYLGITLLKTKKQNSTFTTIKTNKNSSQKLRKAFALGFFTNVFNPKATLFFLSIMVSIVSVQTPLIIKAYYGVWMCLINAFWFILVSVLFSHSTFQNWFQRNTQTIERACGVLLLIFSVQLLVY